MADLLTSSSGAVVNFLSQFTASLDGNPDASNPYIKYYVPYCINSQLLVHVAIYSAACFLTDTGHVERTVAMAHKGHVIKLLNEHIRSQPSPSDEVIAGVLQITLDEWYAPFHFSLVLSECHYPSFPCHMGKARALIKILGSGGMLTTYELIYAGSEI